MKKLAMIVLMVTLSLAYSQRCVTEQEPNDGPFEAVAVTGPGCVIGELSAGEQDFYRWSLPADISQRRQLALRISGTAGLMTRVDVLKLSFSEDGSQLLSRQDILSLVSEAGETVNSEPLLLTEGDYFLGLAQSGSGSYQVDFTVIELGLPSQQDSEPNETSAEAREQQGSFALQGDLEASIDYHRWTVSTEDAEQFWRIEAKAQLGKSLTVKLFSSSGSLVLSANSEDGPIDFANQTLEPDTYTFVLSPASDDASRYFLSATAQGISTAGSEREPNENDRQINSFDPLLGISGSLEQGDVDTFRFVLPEAGYYDLQPGLAGSARLLLFDQANLEIVDMTTDSPSLDRVYLPAGTYRLQLLRASETQPYQLQLVPSQAPEAGFEQEPNNQLSYATALGEALQIRGRMIGRDTDVFSFQVASPENYRIQVLAEKLYDITVYDAAGIQLYSQVSEGRRTRIDNLVLLAGDYYLELDGEDSDYVLRVLSLGKAELGPLEASEGSGADVVEADPEDITVLLPRPAGILEREPNDQQSRAEALRVGETRIGVLNNTRDRDVYQFSLQQDQLVRLELIPPEDAQVIADLSAAGRATMRSDGSLRHEQWLLAGDYTWTVRATEASDGYYQVDLSILNPLDPPADLEPNNASAIATPLMVPSIFEGYVGEFGDDDWFALPTFAQETELQVSFLHDMASNAIQTVYLYDVAAEGWLPDPEISEDKTMYSLIIPADTATTLRVRGQGSYRLRVETDEQTYQATEAQLALDLELEVKDIAAYWHQGQHLSGTLTLRNESDQPRDLALQWHSSDAALSLTGLPSALRLEAASRQTLGIDLRLADDLRDDMPITLSLAAVDDRFTASTQTELIPSCEAPPIASVPYWPIPDAILGHWNVLASHAGTTLIERGEAYYRDLELFDGRASPATGPNHTQGETIYLDLVGDEPLTLTGALLHPLARQDVGGQLADFEILVSLDDQSYESVFQGRLEARRQEQAFVFTEPVEARYVGLRFLTVQSGSERLSASLGEFKLLSPDHPLERVNVADVALGGYVVWSSQVMHQSHPILSETPEGERGERPTLSLSRDENAISWVIGFHHNRAAEIASLEWLDHLNSAEERRIQQVDISVSLDSPTGPWTPLASWELERQSSEGIPEVAPLVLESPVWARFVRFDVNGLEPRGRYDMPETLRLIEHQTEQGLSALGEWGHYSREALYEWRNPKPIDALDLVQDDNDSREHATVLALNSVMSETVTLAKDVDWYRITVPEGDNVLTLGLVGVPSREFSFSLEDSAGQALSYQVIKESASELTLEAAVSPGVYYLKLEEPPRSVVFLWDNSGSMGPYTPIIYNALTRFSADIQQGREEVSLAVFDNGGPYFVLPQMSGHANDVLEALGSYDRRHSSSNAEEALLGSSEMLKERMGSRAILMTTDAESGGFKIANELWQSLAEVKPSVFTFEISSGGRAIPQDLMQSWADAGNGHYEGIASTGDLEVGFARASCQLRRPKAYTISASTETIVRGPGTLKVTQAEPSNETVSPNQAAVEVILDASGSMYKTLEGRFRYEIAKEVLDDLVATTLPDDVPFALRVFGNREESSCRTDLEVPLAPLDRDSVRAVIAGVEPQPFAFTPLAASIAQVASDLAGAEGRKTVILITDGEESCDGDVTASIQALNDQGIDVQLNIIGFDFDAADKQAARAQFQAWAELGQGQYYDAASSAELELSLEQAVALPTSYEVLDQDGNLVLSGMIDGEAVSLEAGYYDILIDAVTVFDNVEIKAETTKELLWQP